MAGAGFDMPAVNPFGVGVVAFDKVPKEANLNG
jgi:hypothetical protein